MCIKKAQDYLRKKQFSSEILVVDNGSVDKSRKICEKLGVRVIIENNKGYGSALRRGIIESKGKYTLMLDSDYTYSLESLDMFVEKIEEGYDLIVGNRFTGLMEKGATPFINKYIGNPILSKVGKLLFPCKINDFHCGIRIFDTEKIKKLNLKTSGMEFASEMIASAYINKLKMIEIPTKLRKPPFYRKSHLHPIKDSLRHIYLLLQLKMNNREKCKWYNKT